MKKNLLFFCTLFCLNSIYFYSQLYAGIEIGSKGIKMSIINVTNVKRGIYTVNDFWTENVGIARGISIDGNLAEEDIAKACKIVQKNYTKIRTELKVEDKNIFIVASSGVGMAKNTSRLVSKIKEITKKDLDIISSQLEAKLLLKGCILLKMHKTHLF